MQHKRHCLSPLGLPGIQPVVLELLALRAASARWGEKTEEVTARKEEKELEAGKIIDQEKSEPSLICPPPRRRNYLPPEDVQSCLESHVQEIFGPSPPGNWLQTPLNENRLKYRLLAQLAAELGHAVPNSQLHLMRIAEDVLNFYRTPVKDVSKFDELCAAELPPNLKIVWQQ
ncbi:large ribosomal subunit protein mL50 isoform X2 [Phalacrocorax carbo]|uniref:large ribosomal subunit protein mL50 isoform X2 n=1 Tax=Phalacrocorax carbo TaxID=9209 RepID=UPI003119E0A5